MPNEAKEEFIIISKMLPKLIEYFIDFMKNKDKKESFYPLNDLDWEVRIKHNSWEVNTITIDAYLWIEKVKYLSLYIPITKKLLKKLQIKKNQYNS